MYLRKEMELLKVGVKWIILEMSNEVCNVFDCGVGEWWKWCGVVCGWLKVSFCVIMVFYFSIVLLINGV